MPVQICVAQTDIDGLMMAKRNLCGGFVYTHSSWKNYWEGTFYRDNANIGKITTQSVMAMANYGITDKLNIIAMAPWISNKPSAGTMMGMQGLQDLSMMLKWQFWGRKYNKLDITTMGILGGSVPMTNYVADFLPISIGMRSKNGMMRLMADVQYGNWFTTLSGTYMVRSNVRIDRNSYYTTEMIYSDQVAMPDVTMYNVRVGWRKNADLFIEAVLDRMNTRGGFDMRKNEMPFLSNDMEATRIGLNCKVPVPKISGLSIMASSMYTVAGRNMGQSFANSAGIVYQVEFKKKGVKQ